MPARKSSNTTETNRPVNSPWLGSHSISSKNRNAMLLAGGSALGFGLWRRGAIGWPMIVGGALLLSRAASDAVPNEIDTDVSFTINRSRQDVYGFWSDFSKWPLFMKGMESAHAQDDNNITWKLTGFTGEGRSQIMDRRPQEFMRWTDFFQGMSYECVIEFRDAPGNRGTEVRWHLHSSSPRNVLAHLLTTPAGVSPEQLARESLRRMKQLLEAGEIPTTDGQPHGNRGLKGRGQRILIRETPDEQKRPSRQVPLPQQQIVAS